MARKVFDALPCGGIKLIKVKAEMSDYIQTEQSQLQILCVRYAQDLQEMDDGTVTGT
jgi:hypothetical protein